MRNLSRVLLFLVLVSLCSDADLAGKKKGKLPPLLPDGFPPMVHDDAELALVPGIASAPAVILLEARQQTWEGPFSRVRYYLRIKILTEAGVEEYGNFSREFYGDWRIKKTEARTVLPDGTEIDASDGVFMDRSTEGVKLIRVAWPQVQVGAILDLHLNVTGDYVSIPTWIVQDYVPVLESRFVLVPPADLRYRTGANGLPPESLKPTERKSTQGRIYTWTFRNVEAIPDEPNQPPLGSIAATMYVVPISLADPTTSARLDLNRDWKSYSGWAKDAWDAWLERNNSDAKGLARQMASDLSTASEKAEAIRRLLHERVDVDFVSDAVLHDSPDEVLREGRGSTGDIAATAVAMLRAVGVKADLASIRLRSSGLIPTAMVVPALFNDLLVRFEDAGEIVYFSPGSDVPADTLPWNHRGIVAVPLDGKCEEPEQIDDFAAAENKSVTIVEAHLDASGGLAGKSQHTFHGVAAQRWRARLADVDEEDRRTLGEKLLRRWMPGLQLTELEIENLDAPAEDLVVQCAWEVDGYAGTAPSRLVLNPHVIERISADEWPEQERETELFLGSTHEDSVVVAIHLPDNAGEVTLPDNRRMNAKSVGHYQNLFERDGRTIKIERYMRLDRYWFPPVAYEGLGRWFRDIAAADDTPIIVQLQ